MWWIRVSRLSSVISKYLTVKEEGIGTLSGVTSGENTNLRVIVV